MRLTKNMCEKWIKEAFVAGWKAFDKNMIIGYWGNEYDGQEISVEEAYIKWREKGRK
jgi:hypothetical protein